MLFYTFEKWDTRENYVHQNAHLFNPKFVILLKK